MFLRLFRKCFQIVSPKKYVIWELRRENREDLADAQKYILIQEEEYGAELRRLYFEKTGNELSLENPQRYTEKIQWRKLYDKQPIYSVLSDKYAVRQWVARKIGEEYLIPLLGVWDKPEDIDFEKLPNAFVLKTNNGSSTNIIVRDKSNLNCELARERLRGWLAYPTWFANGFEMHYRDIPPKIIAEKYMMPVDGSADLTDYKFVCFDGKPFMCLVVGTRSTDETLDYFDMEWKHIDLCRRGMHNAAKVTPKPERFEEMIRLASILSEGFAQVRVDFYELNGSVYFGETTFTSGSGMFNFVPDSFDYLLGDMWNIHEPQVRIGVAND